MSTDSENSGLFKNCMRILWRSLNVSLKNDILVPHWFQFNKLGHAVWPRSPRNFAFFYIYSPHPYWLR